MDVLEATRFPFVFKEVLEAARTDPVKGCPIPGGRNPQREAMAVVKTGNNALSNKEGREFCRAGSGRSRRHPRREVSVPHYDQQGGPRKMAAGTALRPRGTAAATAFHPWREAVEQGKD